MNKIIYTDFFVNRAKRFHKKFVSLKNDVAQLEKELLENPKLGESLGAGLYKVRLAVESKGGGKSSGCRRRQNSRPIRRQDRKVIAGPGGQPGQGHRVGRSKRTVKRSLRS